MDEPLGEEVLRERLGERVVRRIPPLLWALAVGFAFFALVTLVFQPPGATLPLALIDGGGALILASGALLLRRRGVKPHHANAVAAAALLATLAASLAAIKLLRLPAQTTNLLLVELVGSVILLSPAWTGLLVAASLGGWGLVAWSEGLGPEWLNAGFALFVTSVMSVMVQVVRVRDARATEQLSAANEDKATRLEAAVQRERRHVEELASANDSLEAFSYVVAHDLKEPIRGQRALLEDLRDHLDDEERHEIVERLLRAHESLERLVQGLLEWSRVTTTPLEPEPVDVARLLDDPATRAMLDRLLQERRARLLVDHDLPQVQGTPALLRQILANLVLNAVRHNPRSDPQVKVYAAPDAPRGMVDIVVEDNGPGYPRNVLDRFGALKKDRPSTVKGGFGLAIARRAAQRLGGQLVLRNGEEGGAQAHVLLPRVETRESGLSRRIQELV